MKINKLIKLRDEALKELNDKSNFGWYIENNSIDTITAKTLSDSGYNYIVININHNNDEIYYTINNRPIKYYSIADTIKDCKWTY